jgi:hypothetical protein
LHVTLVGTGLIVWICIDSKRMLFLSLLFIKGKKAKSKDEEAEMEKT